jgi:hypothetical protein
MKKYLVFTFLLISLNLNAQSGILVSDDNFIKNSLIAVSDLRSTFLLIEYATDEEEKLFLELCYEYLAYIKSQAVLSKRFSISATRNKIHITAQIIKSILNELDDIARFIENFARTADSTDVGIVKIDTLGALYENLLLLISIYPYSVQKGWFVLP